MHPSINNEALALRNIKAFLSSTFKDLEEERNYLAKYTFPRVIDFCSRRYISFMPIDLRWGITDEEEVTKVCFEEIDRSVPFFIGLVGERYGWIPVREDFGKDFHERCRRTPWLEDAVKEHKSITEIEFMYGALKRDGNCCAAFYVKENVIREARLEKLKEELEHQSRYEIRYYSNIEQLGELVYEDLIHHIERLFPENSSLLSYKRNSHEFMLTQRVRTSVRFETEAWKKLEEWYVGGRRFCAIWSERILRNRRNYESSPGKSILLCNFINHIRKKGCNVIYYDTQAINDEVIEILDDLKDYINGSLREIPENEEVIIALDNLDCIDVHDNDSEEAIISLFDNLPSRARAIISSRGGSWKRVFDFDYILQAEPDAEQKDLIIDKYLSSYGKKLTPQEKSLIATSGMTLNEIRHILDSLIRFGSYEDLTKEIEKYRKGDLMWILIEDINKDTTDKNGIWEAMWILTIIALSGNAGITEKEIIDYGKLTPARWASIRQRILELCDHQGPFYTIYGQDETLQTLLNLSFPKFRDTLIDRFKKYIAEKGISSRRMGIIIPSLYLHYIGADQQKEDYEKWNNEHRSIYQDVEIVNNMPLYLLKEGWGAKYLGLKVADTPKDWTLRKTPQKYSRQDLIRYYTRLKRVTAALELYDDNLICIERLHTLTGNDHQYFLDSIALLCQKRMIDKACKIYTSKELNGQKRLEAATVLGKGAFDSGYFDVAEKCIGILKADKTRIEDFHLFHESRLLILEYRIFEIFSSSEEQNIRTALLKDDIHNQLNKLCQDILKNSRSDNVLIAKVYQLMGYTQMMIRNYMWGVKTGLNTYVSHNMTAWTRKSLKFHQAIIEYGLGLLAVGQKQLANDHFRTSKIWHYQPEQLTNPWLICSLEIMTRTDGVDPVYKKEAARLLGEISELPQFSNTIKE